jgi:hypothetical protein
MRDSSLVVLLVLLALVGSGCGGTNTPATTAPPGGETSACRDERLAILDAMAASRAASSCTSAADCAVVTGPGSPSSEHDEIVAASDASTLEARSEAHLEACGAFHHDAAIDAYREVAATCVEGHCAIEETLVHVPPLDE